MAVDEKFIIKRDGKDFVLYAGLLDEAHKQGLMGIETKIVQLPHEENGHTAVVVATAYFEKGSFSGIGDANAGNVNRMMAPHIIRMAETRAKARALRDGTNIGVTAFEELGGDDDPQLPYQNPKNQQESLANLASAVNGARRVSGQEDKAITDVQLADIKMTRAELGMPSDELLAIVKREFGALSPVNLSYAEGEQLQRILRFRLKEAGK